MTKDNIYYYNHQTGEEIIREMTDEEQAERDAQVAAWLAEQEAKAQAEAQARAIKISAYEKLGLTPEEIEALVPTPQPDTQDLGGN